MINETPIALVPGLSALASRYDLILCDVWGVIHNGVAAFMPAVEALARFRQQGGVVILVSNAPRPGAVIVEQLDRLAVLREAYDTIVTSGDITRDMMAGRPAGVVHHLGPPRDLPVFDGMPLRLGTIEEADYVVCTGLDDDERDTIADYRGRLERIRSRDLWMICANPDLVVERGHRLIPCAGAIAAAYEDLGGEVFWAGKPHRPIYEAALRRAAELREGRAVPAERVLAVGDAIRTDIAGAEAFGIDSLFIASGIHGRELELGSTPLTSPRVSAWAAGQTVRPRAVAERLLWG